MKEKEADREEERERRGVEGIAGVKMSHTHIVKTDNLSADSRQ